MKLKVHPCITPGRDGLPYMDTVREVFSQSLLAPALSGEFMQVDMVSGGNSAVRDLHTMTAREILSHEPEHPEKGFSTNLGRALARTPNPVAAFIDYEPGQPRDGSPTLPRNMRFDTGLQKRYDRWEIDLTDRCMDQIRNAGLMGGFYNTPAGMGTDANVLALIALHHTVDTSFVFANANSTTHKFWGDYRYMRDAIKLRRKQFKFMGEDAPKVYAWTMPRDNSNDIPTIGGFHQGWVRRSHMKAKGWAAKRQKADSVMWINASWFKDEANIPPILDALNGYGEGLGL